MAQGMHEDRSEVIAAASKGGWQISPVGNDITLRKGARQVRVKFTPEGEFVKYLDTGKEGRGGLRGAVRTLEAG